MAQDAATGARSWGDARQVMCLLAVDPALLGGVRIRSWYSPAREQWLRDFRALCQATAESAAVVELPVQTPPDRLLGGLDLATTLQSGKRHVAQGLLPGAHDGVLVVRGAERLDNTQLAAINEALDHGRVHLERDGLSCILPAKFGCIALDEGVPFEEGIGNSLADRLAFDIDLHSVALSDVHALGFDSSREFSRVKAAAALLDSVEAADALLPALCQSAWQLNIRSLRAPALALRVARVAAALAGSNTVQQEHAEIAVRLVFGPRAIASSDQNDGNDQNDQNEEANSTPPDAETESDEGRNPDDDEPFAEQKSQANDANVAEHEDKEASPEELAEVLVAAAQASLPAQLLGQASFAKMAELRGTAEQGSGRFGPSRPSLLRGVPLPSRQGALGGHARLDLLATLRRAMPWQKARSKAPNDNALNGNANNDTIGSSKIRILPSDFSLKRFKQHAPTVTLFVVDASGSAAMQRLAEAKGAVESLLAECYVRRDEVGLVAFRGTTAELLLPPTRSLVRAKRVLGQLVGGGGTPLPAGLRLALSQSRQLQRRGAVPLLVLLTDGSANVNLAGLGSRAEAQEEARVLASVIGATGAAMIVVDSSVRGQKLARELAERAGGTYLALPYAQQDALLNQVRTLTHAGRSPASRR